MYRHIKNYEIKYIDVDAFDNIKASALLGFMQESACLSADELGFGYADIAPKNLGFILANWYVDMLRPVRLGEELEIHTWPLKPRHLIFLRDFEFYVGGEKVGVASARWCMIDTASFKFLPVGANFEEGFFDNYNTERSIEFSSWKIADCGGKALSHSRRVGLSDYDHYFHANNTKYADFMTDAFSVDELRGKYFKSVQISYVKQCKEGETLEIFKARGGDGYYYIDGKAGEELRVQFKVLLNEI